MTLAAAALVAGGFLAGAIIGLLRRASWRLLEAPTIRWSALGVVGVAAGVFFALVSIESASLYTAVALAALLAFTLRNVHLVGMPVIAIGLALNLAGVAINQGYSIDEKAAQQAKQGRDLAENQHFDERSDPAWFLGQVVPLEPLHSTVSFGDLITSLGMLNTSYRVVRRRRRPSISLTSSARVGLSSVAASSRRITDQPVIDLRLARRATWLGYAERTRDLTAPAPSTGRRPSTTAGLRPGPHQSEGSSTRPDPSE